MPELHLNISLDPDTTDPATLRAFIDNQHAIRIHLTYATQDPTLVVTWTGEAANLAEGHMTIAFAAKVLGKHRSTVYRWLDDGTLKAPADGLVEADAVLTIAERWRGK